MQQDSQLLAMLLWLTGGLLELQKCSYHMIHFEFKEDGRPQFRTEAPDIPLGLRQANTNKDITITYKTVYNLHNILGYYKAPAGTSKMQENILIKKTEQYACKVKKSLLYRHKALMHYTSCYLKSIGYVLSQTFLTKHTLEHVNLSPVSEGSNPDVENRDSRQST
eukprot:7328817-Ditylum_brightwellii.AAC.1